MSAIPDQPSFPHVAEDGDVLIDPSCGNAVLRAYQAFRVFSAAPSPIDAAYALTEMHDAMSDVSTWLPGYDPETGEVNAPE